MFAPPFSRVQVGLPSFDVSVDPLAVFLLQEEVDRQILADAEPYIVKLYGFDDAGQIIGEFTGTMYSTEPLILTAGHAMNFGANSDSSKGVLSSGVKSFRAKYHDGYEEAVDVLVPPMQNFDLDVMLLKGSKVLSSKPLPVLEDVMRFTCWAADQAHHRSVWTGAWLQPTIRGHDM
eukprot:GHUV01018560.1.p1 GENE.GHUV01018560.1~~GHUV01018560.1.p1  ORF type:complete len:176 (-),score=35.72 GHUV01018560.1:916-1443(-)